VAPGQYMLKQQVPAGYGYFSPDSFAVDFVNTPANVHHDFADTARIGGWLSDRVFVDTNGNHVQDSGDLGIEHATIWASCQSGLTDGNGDVKFFLSPGSYRVTCAAPDSYTVTSTNPVSITMTNGGTATADFGVLAGVTGTVQGSVYKDLNKNGIYDAGEP